MFVTLAFLSNRKNCALLEVIVLQKKNNKKKNKCLPLESISNLENNFLYKQNQPKQSYNDFYEKLW